MTDPVFELPAIAADATPEFGDVLGCKAWLEHVPLANVAEAQRQLLAQVTEFNRSACPAPMRLEVFEALREAVAFVQIEQAKRFTNRALPMAEMESAIFDATTALWEQMRLGYLRCLAASRAGEPGMQAHAALLAQRVLAYGGLKMFHHYRAYREVARTDWRALHQVYKTAEAMGVVEEAVKDYLNRDVHDASPHIQYMRALLMGMANPNELARRQLSFVGFLLERWAEKVDLAAQPVAEEGMLPLVVDLAGDRPPERLTGVGDAAVAEPRYLDVARLTKSLKNRIALLRKGESPAKLALGEDCVQPSCEQLLIFLFRQWCQPRPARAERKRVVQEAMVCNDMAAIHYYIGGRVFRQPGAQTELSQRDRDQIATFGRVSTKDEDDYSAVHGFLLEHWNVEDESVSGLRMVRPAGSPGKRYAHGQLVAVRPGDAKNFMLAQARWLMQAGDGALNAGLRLLPGLPAAIAVKNYGLNVTAAEKWVPALTLTEVAALKSPPTLILPVGWFKPKRVVEVFVQQPLRVRLDALVDRGTDFERMSYEVLPD